MSKKRRGTAGNTRDAPQNGNVMVCDQTTWRVLCGDGYRPIMQCPEVQMCIGVYADLIASMTIHLMQNTSKGDVRIKNGLSRKLDIDPNPWMTHQTFIGTIVRALLSEGNQVTVPVFNGREELLDSMIPVPPSKVSFVQDGEGYKINIGGQMVPPDEVLHFSVNPDPEMPWKGQGYRAALADVVKCIRQAQSTKNALLENPAPALLVKVDGFVDDLQSPEGRERLAQQYLSNTSAGKPWLLEARSFEVQQVKPMSMNDLALRDHLELDKKSVAAIFGVPAFLVGVGEFKAEEFDWFVSNRVMAVARILEQELTKKLLWSPELYFRMNPRSLLNYDIKKVVEVCSAMLDRIAMDRNEARDWLGMAPREDMEELLALENYIPATKLGEQKKLEGGGEDAQ